MLRKKLLLLLGAAALVSGLASRPSEAAFCRDLTHCRAQNDICRANCVGLSGDALNTCEGNCIRAYMACYSSC